jgi:hypothetical protein
MVRAYPDFADIHGAALAATVTEKRFAELVHGGMVSCFVYADEPGLPVILVQM